MKDLINYERGECEHGRLKRKCEICELTEELAQAVKERDEAVDAANTLTLKLNEAIEKLDDWENAAKHVDARHPDEVHCGCVPILWKQLDEARNYVLTNPPIHTWYPSPPKDNHCQCDRCQLWRKAAGLT